MSIFRPYNPDGTLSRTRRWACQMCGSWTECDECWEHVKEWSAFGIWECSLCRMPQAIHNEKGWQHAQPTCEFCGWDEATFK